MQAMVTYDGAHCKKCRKVPIVMGHGVGPYMGLLIIYLILFMDLSVMIFVCTYK